MIPSFRAICFGVKFNAHKFRISCSCAGVIIYYSGFRSYEVQSRINHETLVVRASCPLDMY
ncbi:MAG: hypothetical protein ACK5OU_12230, partial [Dolichospermum sp.]